MGWLIWMIFQAQGIGTVLSFVWFLTLKQLAWMHRDPECESLIREVAGLWT